MSLSYIRGFIIYNHIFFLIIKSTNKIYYSYSFKIKSLKYTVGKAHLINNIFFEVQSKKSIFKHQLYLRVCIRVVKTLYCTIIEAIFIY